MDATANLALYRELVTAAGQPDLGDEVVVETLTGGRTGGEVTRFADDACGYVLKRFAAEGWRDAALEGAPGGEAAMWQHGMLSELPGSLYSATIYAARRDDHWLLLMRDVGDGIRPRGGFADDDEQRLLTAVAGLHAKYWDKPLDDVPVCTARGWTRLFADPLIAFAGGDQAVARAPSWVQRFLDDFQVLGMLAPRFFELLGERHSQIYLDMARDRSWEAELDAGVQTVLHGDLRRANIAFDGDDTFLIDWEFSCRGPAASDLAWHWFLHFWAYPPDDRDPMRPDLLASYLDALQDRLGSRIDEQQFRRQWQLAWVRIMVQLGYCMADPSMGDTVTDAQVAEVRERCIAAVERAASALA